MSRFVCFVLMLCCLFLFDFARPIEAQDRSEGNVAEEAKNQQSKIDSVLQHGTFTSSYDQTQQPFYYSLPEDWEESPKPVFVFLHSWSASYKQYKSDWVQAAQKRGWIFLQPNFRGPNTNPKAGGSAQARQDILDCVDLAIEKFQGDPNRVYLAGASGGGHMALLMAGRHSSRFSAVSAWVPITDLEAWYQFHVKDNKVGNYAKMVAALCGGRPGKSPAIEFQYRERSPIYWVDGVESLPVEISAGVHDGKKGSVHIDHSILFFNKLAENQQASQVSDQERAELWENQALGSPLSSDLEVDPSYGRELKLRRYAGKSRLTIFEGGHEGLAEPACFWLEKQTRMTRPDRVQKKSSK